MTELSPVVLDVFDLGTGRHTYFSGGSVTLFGYTAEELTQMPDKFAVLVHPDDMPRLTDNLARLRQLADGEIHEFECRVRRRDGAWRWVAARSMVFARNAQGEVWQTVNAAFDVTERKRAEDALRRAHEALEQRVMERTQQLTVINAELIEEIDERMRAEAELRRLKDELADDLEAMQRLHELSTRLLTAGGLPSLLEEVLSATINLQHADFGNVQLYNPHTKSLEIVVQRGFKQDFLDHFSAVAEDSSACGRALQRGERVIIEDVECDPGFEPHRPIAASAGFRAVQSTPLVSRSGEPLGMLSTHFRDPHRPSERELRLTDLYARQVAEMIERKQAKEALGEAQAQLAHVTRMMTLGELTASIAHEVNQPLGAIVTNGHACLRLLARESPDLQKSREVVQRMISDGLRASDVITRIRALVKRHDAEQALMNVNAVVQDVIALTSPELSKSEIHLRIALAADLPLVRGDRVQLQQVLLNLILNAKEAMSGVGWLPRELCITSRASTSGEAVVAVRDSGTGLDPRDGDRIFDAFFTTKAEGLGLGLPISRTIVEAHGGRLWATSNDGPGATVQFTLPIEH
jgi:PAS domain S-box-containing protein